MIQLSGLDATFIYTETVRSPNHVSGVAIYDPTTAPAGHVSFDDVVGHISSRLSADKSFRRVVRRVPLDLDHPYWVDDTDFDIEYHVRHLALPAPGDWNQLRTQVSRLHERALDLRRPPWEFYLIDGLASVDGYPRESFALYWKLHHAAIDGVTGMGIVNAIHDLEPDAAPRPTDAWQPNPGPSTSDLLVATAANLARRPGRLASLVGRSAPHAVSRLVRRKPEVDAPPLESTRSRLNASIDSRRTWDAQRFDLEAIKRIRTLVPGASVNDVVLSIVGGGIRAYLQAVEDLPERSLVAFMPLTVRPEILSDAGGNQIAVARVTLATDIADPVERLVAVHESAERSKAVRNAPGGRALVDYSEFLPGALLGVAARTLTSINLVDRFTPPANTAVTNVPGPQFPLYFAGAQMLANFGMPPILEGGAVIHAVSSYCGDLVITVTTCPKVVPDVTEYVAHFRREFDALVDAASSGPQTS